MNSEKKRIGIFGGSFDPPHLGHVKIVDVAIKELELDDVIVVPAQQNPMKDALPLDPFHRMAMCCLAFGGKRVCDYELTRPAPSYTINTVKHIKFLYPEADLFLIVGSDCVSSLPQWKQIDEIVDEALICVFVRGEEVLDSPYVFKLMSKISLVSSTFIREKLAQKSESALSLVPEKVKSHILRYGLYSVDG